MGNDKRLEFIGAFINEIKSTMAEREGFEPSIGDYPILP